MYSIVQIFNNLLIYLPVDRHLSCFLFVTITNNAFINICVQVLSWTYIHFCWVNIWEWNFWGHRVKCMIIRNYQFFKLFVPFHSPTSNVWLSIAPHLPQHLELASLFILSIPTNVRSLFWFVCAFEHKLDENPLKRQGNQYT